VKYVVVRARGLELPILFPAVFQHREAVEHLNATPISAGMCRVSILPDGTLHVDAVGGSLSLGINSRECDALLIRTHLQHQDI
jgi:hypothetical protein